MLVRAAYKKFVFCFHEGCESCLEAQGIGDYKCESKHDEADDDAPYYHLRLLLLLGVALVYFGLVFLVHIIDVMLVCKCKYSDLCCNMPYFVAEILYLYTCRSAFAHEIGLYEGV